MMDFERNSDIPTNIPEFYNGRSVLITGFTGYLGKLIAEKLLFSCPGVKHIYVLVRAKKGEDSIKRFEETIKSEAFKRLREKYPGVIESKLIPLSGDICEDRLGLSEENEEELRREVSVIFHSAASIRFIDTLDVAVNLNVQGVKNVVDLALTIPKLAAFVYISTAYSNCDKSFIKEDLYPAKADWKDLIEITNKVDIASLRVLTNKYLDTMPNTYVFTKAIGEHVINDYRDRLPVVIVRPSIVFPAYKEPEVGWTDNQFGPLFVAVGLFLGLIRCSWIDGKQELNAICSDIVINSAIISSWKTAMTYSYNVIKDSVTVYNATTPPNYTLSSYKYSQLHINGAIQRDLKNNNIDQGYVILIKNKLWYRINILFRHVLPAAMVDLMLIIMKQKPILLNIRKKIFTVSEATSYFTLRTFYFENEKFTNLLNILSVEDKEYFGWDFSQCDFYNIHDNAFEHLKKSVLSPICNAAYRKKIKMMYWVDRSAVYMTYSILAWIIYSTITYAL